MLERALPQSLLLPVLAMMATAGPANAQGEETCTAVTAENPPRAVYTCPGGLTVEAEAAAALGLHLADAPDGPRRAELGGAAALIEVLPGQGGFEVRTPHAIASVRGTVFAVDVSPEETAVFVVEGQVAVARWPEPGAAGAVLLSEGEGTTVRPGAPLTVRQWGAEKVAALLARFGR